MGILYINPYVASDLSSDQFLWERLLSVLYRAHWSVQIVEPPNRTRWCLLPRYKELYLTYPNSQHTSYVNIVYDNGLPTQARLDTVGNVYFVVKKIEDIPQVLGLL